MGGRVSSNRIMVDRLATPNSNSERHWIRSEPVESAFRAVDRGMYYDLEDWEQTDPYIEDPWRRGNLHLSAPCIYAKVVEALDLRQGQSFLNMGSGTGYLSTIVGLMIGPNGTNHGIEYHGDVVEFARRRLEEFKRKSSAIHSHGFAEPTFIEGNCLDINPECQYDRVYLGAACLPDMEEFMKRLVKCNGGILVMPYQNLLYRYERVSEDVWQREKLMEVSFTSMIPRQMDNKAMINMPAVQVKSLKDMCRVAIRQLLRTKTDMKYPNLKHSDNLNARKCQRLLRRKRYDMVQCKTMSLLSHRRDFSAQTHDGQQGSDISFHSLCCCHSNAKRNWLPSSSHTVTKGVQTDASIRVGRSGVRTRSAARRLGDDDSSAPPNRTARASIEIKPEPAVIASLRDDSDSNDGEDLDVRTCARTRPFVADERQRARATNDRDTYRRHSPAGPYRAGTRDASTTCNTLSLPYHARRRSYRRIVSPSSSSSSSSSSSELRAGRLEQYDYVRDQILFDLPSLLNNSRRPEIDATLRDNPDGSSDNSDDEPDVYLSSASSNASVMNSAYEDGTVLNAIERGEGRVRAESSSSSSNEDEEDGDDYDDDHDESPGEEHGLSSSSSSSDESGPVANRLRSRKVNRAKRCDQDNGARVAGASTSNDNEAGSSSSDPHWTFINPLQALRFELASALQASSSTSAPPEAAASSSGTQPKTHQTKSAAAAAAHKKRKQRSTSSESSESSNSSATQRHTQRYKHRCPEHSQRSRVNRHGIRTNHRSQSSQTGDINPNSLQRMPTEGQRDRRLCHNCQRTNSHVTQRVPGAGGGGGGDELHRCLCSTQNVHTARPGHMSAQNRARLDSSSTGASSVNADSSAPRLGGERRADPPQAAVRRLLSDRHVFFSSYLRILDAADPQCDRSWSARRRESESERYRRHIARYISDLPLPPELLLYLEFDETSQPTLSRRRK